MDSLLTLATGDNFLVLLFGSLLPFSRSRYLLRKAIETEKAEMFQAVMTTISDKLTEEEVRRCTIVEVAY